MCEEIWRTNALVGYEDPLRRLRRKEHQPEDELNMGQRILQDLPASHHKWHVPCTHWESVARISRRHHKLPAHPLRNLLVDCARHDQHASSAGDHERREHGHSRASREVEVFMRVPRSGHQRHALPATATARVAGIDDQPIIIWSKVGAPLDMPFFTQPSRPHCAPRRCRDGGEYERDSTTGDVSVKHGMMVERKHDASVAQAQCKWSAGMMRAERRRDENSSYDVFNIGFLLLRTCFSHQQ